MLEIIRDTFRGLWVILICLSIVGAIVGLFVEFPWVFAALFILFAAWCVGHDESHDGRG